MFLETVLAEGEVWVPALWWYENSNVLVAAMRRKRLAKAKIMHLAELYSSIPIHTDAAPSPAVAMAIQQLALNHRLSAYDAAYLELAHRLGTGLATLDHGEQVFALGDFYPVGRGLRSSSYITEAGTAGPIRVCVRPS